jgi:hypothetical protein
VIFIFANIYEGEISKINIVAALPIKYKKRPFHVWGENAFFNVIVIGRNEGLIIPESMTQAFVDNLEKGKLDV